MLHTENMFNCDTGNLRSIQKVKSATQQGFIFPVFKILVG